MQCKLKDTQMTEKDPQFPKLSAASPVPLPTQVERPDEPGRKNTPPPAKAAPPDPLAKTETPENAKISASSANLAADDTEETTLDGRYQVTHLLGEGGMGTVYQAKHVLMDKTVAVKVIHEALVHSDSVVKRFQREAKSASRLTDPHCINVTDFGRTGDGKLFLVMEYLEGETLSERLRKGPLPLGKAIQIAKHILKALAHAHEQGVVHRDLKPDNVMLINHGDEQDFAKVFDFGIAKFAAGDDGFEEITQAGLVLGTPSYLSPEQGTGKEIDHRADLYAVGVILFEMLAGERPFKGHSAKDVVLAHLSSPIPSLPASCEAPFALQKIVKKALAKKPESRFATARQFLEALDEIDPTVLQPHEPFIDIGRLFYPLRKAIARVLSRRFYPIPTAIRRKLEQLETSSFGSLAQPITGQLARMRPQTRRALVAGALLFIVALLGLLWNFALRENGDAVAVDASLSGADEPRANEETVASLLERANAELTNQLAKKASATARQALRLDPDQPTAHLLLGHSLFLRGDHLGATKSYASALLLDRSLVDDRLLLTHLEEALKHPKSRENAASILAEFSGKKGIEILASRANSSLSSGDERAVARQALIVTNHEEAIDWVASLSADFHEQTSCGKRREIVAQIEETGDPKFLPLLESELRKPTTSRTRSHETNTTRNPFKKLREAFNQDKDTNKDKKPCPIENDIRRAYRTLSKSEKG